MNETEIHPSEAITILITRRIRDGGEPAFEDALKRWIPRLHLFPGHLGVHMLRPLPGDHEYGAVLKFRSRRDWQEFQQAPDYKQFLLEISPLLDTDPGIVTVNGLESWFTPPGDSTSPMPPRWKMAVVTWIGVCFTVYVVTLLLTPLIGKWPWLPRFLTNNAGVVVGLTWCVMPFLTNVFRSWLTPRPSV